MTQAERQSWEKIRAQGQDRFLVRFICRRGWMAGTAYTFFDVCWSLLFHRPLQPVWGLAIQWAAMSVVIGALVALQEWRARERDYEKQD